MDYIQLYILNPSNNKPRAINALKSGVDANSYGTLKIYGVSDMKFGDNYLISAVRYKNINALKLLINFHANPLLKHKILNVTPKQFAIIERDKNEGKIESESELYSEIVEILDEAEKNYYSDFILEYSHMFLQKLELNTVAELLTRIKPEITEVLNSGEILGMIYVASKIKDPLVKSYGNNKYGIPKLYTIQKAVTKYEDQYIKRADDITDFYTDLS